MRNAFTSALRDTLCALAQNRANSSTRFFLWFCSGGIEKITKFLIQKAYETQQKSIFVTLRETRYRCVLQIKVIAFRPISKRVLRLYRKKVF